MRADRVRPTPRSPSAIAAALAVGLGVAGHAAAESLTVPIDHSARLQLGRGQAASVIVGNPGVADVTVVDSHTVFVSGRAYGATDVTVLDRSGRAVFTGDVIVGAAQTGRVSVYRAGARVDLACAPGCQVAARVDGGGAPGGGSLASVLARATAAPGM